MSDLEYIKANLVAHRKEFRERFHIQEIGIFGSYVRGENKPGSDLDILVDFDDVPGLLTFIRIKNYLSSIAGVPVDLVMKRALKPYIGKHIIRETVYL